MRCCRPMGRSVVGRCRNPRRCPSSTPTTPPGNVSGWTMASATANWLIGLGTWGYAAAAAPPWAARASGATQSRRWAGADHLEPGADRTAQGPGRRRGRDPVCVAAGQFPGVAAPPQWSLGFTRGRACGQPYPRRNRSADRLFVNTQVLKAQVRGEDTFSELLAQMRDTALKAQTFQDLPFEQLVDALQPERSLSHSPLFQVMFNHQHDAPSQARALDGGLRVENLATEVRSAKFDLTLNTFEHATGIDANIIYSRELFDAALIDTLAGQWQRLLAAVAQNPRQRIEALPALDTDDQLQVREWGVGEPVAFAEQDVLALFAAQVDKAPTRSQSSMSRAP
ncbi:hypothetical protein EJJ20_25975 [Pseudomonas poae]|nr:hypothetical protein EJJ20_25975 [Pseudomonas poae]